ncbi:hypothetical protein CITRIK5_70382 [Citricoccus sp. K5]|nr:hypothetical protein CITRIK5_70382 [Citricoccus sp. K5]
MRQHGPVEHRSLRIGAPRVLCLSTELSTDVDGMTWL